MPFLGELPRGRWSGITWHFISLPVPGSASGPVDDQATWQRLPVATDPAPVSNTPSPSPALAAGGGSKIATSSLGL